MGKLLLTSFLIILLLVLPIKAWDGHQTITLHSLTGLAGLNISLEEKEYSYAKVDQGPYNPEFVPQYIHGDKEQITAWDVLVDYSQEPDWGLDKGLSLDRRQILTGGSQGWRHQRYTLLNGWIALGIAPDRAAHFYDLAVHAYKAGDDYWAFRFLSRSLHYLQDMGQPFHSLPMPISHLFTRHRLNINSATMVGENVHYNLEWYVAHLLSAKQHPALVASLTGSDLVEIDNVRQAAIDLNNSARQVAQEQYDLVSTIWEQLNSRESVVVDFATEDVPASEELARLHEIVEETLKLTAEYSRGLVSKFLMDLGIE